MTLSGFLDILKHNGPIIAVLLGIIWLQWRHIDKLLERNASIYEGHIKALYKTQERLLTRIIGPQQSSLESPTIDQVKEIVKSGSSDKTTNGEKK